MNELLLSRRHLLAGSAAFSALMLGGFGAARSAEGDILRIRSDLDIQVLDPAFMIGGTEIDLQYACLGALTVFAPGDSLSWRPSAFVESVEQRDELHIDFVLRQGIKWSGGFGELTSEDVKFSYERIADPNTQSPWQSKWAALQTVEIAGPYSGTIVLKEPFAPLWYTTLCDGAGAIVCKKAVEAEGGRFTTAFPAMCGPYVMKRWLPKQRVELVANPDWTGPKPAFPEVHIYFVEDEKAAELGYEAGDLDLTHLSPDSVNRYLNSPPPESRLMERPGLAWTWMGMNTEHPKLSDIRVRQAILRAVDVDEILQAVYGGNSPRAHGPIPPGLLGHRTSTAYGKPDLAKARTLLDEAGISGLSLELKTLNETIPLTTAQVIQAHLAQIGIDVQILPLDSGPFWNLGLESEGDDWKDLQLWIMRYQDAPDPSQMTQWYTSDQVGVWNWERWRNSEFDRLHRQALSETDPAGRGELYIRMQEIMEETAAYLWITHEPTVLIYRDHMVPEILPPDHPYLLDFKRA